MITTAFAHRIETIALKRDKIGINIELHSHDRSATSISVFNNDQPPRLTVDGVDVYALLEAAETALNEADPAIARDALARALTIAA